MEQKKHVQKFERESRNYKMYAPFINIFLENSMRMLVKTIKTLVVLVNTLESQKFGALCLLFIITAGLIALKL